jgi:hypothetical protein
MADDQGINPQTVEALLGFAEDVLADERTRGQNLDSKTASLATFSGTILALDATLGAGLLRRSLGCVGDILVPLFFLVTAGALLIAAAVAVCGVLIPQRYLGIETAQVSDFASRGWVTADRTEVQGRVLMTVSNLLVPAERARNERKASLTKTSAVCLGVGLIGIAGQAITLGVHELGI